MAFNLFGPPTKDDIRVGYIDPNLGYVEGFTICQANEYASKNPGTTFVFRNGNNVIQYLNVNEVNQLDPSVLTSTDECGGINQKKECGPPTIQMFGGGGIGAAGNPIIGRDGALLAVDVVRGGNGYQYPPIVAARDNCNYGSGATLTAVLGEVTETIETYENEADFEDYELCEPTDVGYGRRYGPNGEDLGPWEPQSYTEPGQDPIRREVDEFQEIVRRLARKPFFSSIENRPTNIVCSEPKVLPQVYDVRKTWGPEAFHPNEFMNSYAISPVPPSNVPGSDFAGRLFTFEWTEDFPTDGEYIFRMLCDNVADLYVDNLKVTSLKNMWNSTSKGGAVEPVIPVKKTLKKGIHKVRVDLLNLPFYENVTSAAQPVDQAVGGQFHLKGDGYYLKVGGNDRVQLSFKLDWSGTGDSSKTAVTRIVIPTEEGSPVVLERTKQGNIFTVSGTASNSGIFKANKDYGPILFEGTTGGTAPEIINSGDININPGAFQQAIVFQDSNDSNPDVDARLDIIGDSGVQLSGPRGVESSGTALGSSGKSTQSNIEVKKVFNTVDFIGRANRTLWRGQVTNGRDADFVNKYGVLPFDPDSAAAQTQSFSGTHTIIWNDVDFPVDGSYNIELWADDSVTLTITNNSGFKEIIRKEGFTINSQGIFSTGKSVETRTFGAGKYKIQADLFQENVAPLASGRNPMVLAVNIDTPTVTETVISPKSWQENAMAVALTIDAPAPPIPQEPAPIQEGRCPPNPIWSTRFPGAKETWYPVKFNGSKSPQGKKEPWAKFFNRYAISPVPPLDTPGSDAGGVLFTNSWEIDIPYDGFYKFAAQRDDTARIFVDGKLAFDVTTAGDDIWRDFRNKPKFQKIFITKGRHTIGIELENTRTETFSQISQKIFRTKDWQVASITEEQPAGSLFIKEGDAYYILIGGNDVVEIDFIFDWYDDEQFGYAVTKITIPTESKGPIIFSRPLSGTVGSSKATGTFSANKKYGPIIFEGTASGSRNPEIVDVGPAADQRQQRIIFWDANANDTIPNAQLTAITARQLSPARVVGGLTGGTAKDGVTYEGPPIFAYKDNRWGEFMNNNSISPVIPGEGGSDRKTFTWKGVRFPESGQYDITFLADNNAKLIIGGKEVLTSQGFAENPQIFKVNITQGTYDVVIDSEYPYITAETNTQQYFRETNPTGFGLVIRKNVSVRSNTGKSWDENPIGIGAILIPPPCPRRIRGRGVVTNVIVNDPGNGYLRPIPQDQGYPVALRLKEVIVENPGINYNCGVDELRITPSNGAELDYICDPFGKIREVKVLNPGLGFTEYPEIRLISETGVNASFRPVFEVVRDPIVLPERLIQVTDLVGLKQTGYVNGRPYYGAVYYDQGVRYAGFYETVGDLVQVYDTLQESITAQVTTAPNAIERQGTDITSNDPRLNIPGTPQNLI
jgi:hypothetical protein